MRKKSNQPDSLRAEAEAQLVRAPPTEATALPETLLHELRVHQIELEMQNEELRRAQVIIEESRDRYMELYEFSPVGYLTVNRVGMISEVNLTAAALLGVDRKKLLNRRFSGLISPEDRDHWLRDFQRLLHVEEHHNNCDLKLQHVDGSPFHAMLNCRRIKSENSLLVHITLSDITERKRAEEELRISAIAFESQEGMILTDSNGVILRVNRAFTKLTGYSAKEAVGKTPALLKSGRQSKEFYEELWSSLNQKHYWQGEMWNKRKNGKIYAEWLTISAVTAPDGSITHYVGAFSEITQNKEAEAEIHRLAYYDPLTQLSNRRLLYDRLSQARAASNREGQYCAILFLDMDNFKTLNDTLGHDVGDLLLVEVAKRLTGTIREGDTVARLGGDEFVLLLEDLSDDVRKAAIQVGLIGDKVIEIIAEPFLLQEVEYSCTTSIGATLFHGHDDSVDTLLKHADLAMYQAKKDGRNRLRFFDPAMQATLNEFSALERHLRQALELKQLHLYYQIQVNSSGQALGAEALLRWQHPERGMILPAQFIPVAEETGLIVPIGLWVLQKACAQISDWSGNTTTQNLKLAINVSARQFRQKDFVEQVQQAVSATGINPACLKIELTESLVLDNVSETIAKMHALKALGIRFSMDDFGTGYSSLSYLKQLPLDQLKIDQSFVRNIINNVNDATIVKAIITMGQTFGFHVIAEGVETEAQRGFLDQHGCHAFQGYLFSKPIPIEQFNELLKTKYL